MTRAHPRAVLSPDAVFPGALTLTVDGVTQSTVLPGDPEQLLLEYVRRIGNAIDALAPDGQELRALHLGAGALTLPRFIAATRPGSRQIVVEHDVALLDLVLDRLPLPEGEPIALITADALEAVQALSAQAFEAFDVIVVDVYDALVAPGFVYLREFFSDLEKLRTPEGIVLVNVVDGPALQASRAGYAAMSASVPATIVVGPAPLLEGERYGNAVLIGGRADTLERLLPLLNARGPHPAASASIDGTRALLGVAAD